VSPRLALIAGALAVLAALVVAAAPRAESQEQRIERIAAELRCPVCQGLSVADSPSDTAREMRALIAQRVAEGRSDGEIRDEFRRAYGDWVLLSPPLLDARGAVWLVPLAVVLAGLAVVASRLGRAPPLTAPSPDQVALLRARAAEDEEPL